ncbi:MAG: rane protein [Frankiales bacterium]|nr:rane protein [Frankiales bacterium]
MTYRERWVVPLVWWPCALGLATLVAAELHSGAPGARAVLPYAVLLPLTAVLLATGSRGQVTVTDGVLHVPGARIPVALLDHGVVLDREAFRIQAGPMADPNAFVVSRPWLHTAVRLMVDDPADPTPYWIVGTSRPAELLSAISRAVAAQGALPADGTPPSGPTTRGHTAPS